MAKKKEKLVIGWREWVALPEYSAIPIKAKIDSGARTSSLHATDIVEIKRGHRRFVQFLIHPDPKDFKHTIKAVSEVLEYRKVKDSGGTVTLRPVVITMARIGGIDWPIELTLISRSDMKFRMLLGRQAIRKKFLIDTSRSFLQDAGGK